jgi:hypothetical protein
VVAAFADAAAPRATPQTAAMIDSFFIVSPLFLIGLCLNIMIGILTKLCSTTNVNQQNFLALAKNLTQHLKTTTLNAKNRVFYPKKCVSILMVDSHLS